MLLYQKKVNDCWYNSWGVYLNLPWVGKGSPESCDFFDTNAVQYGVKLPTHCVLVREPNVSWRFDLSVLGFGVTVMRQKGY